MEWFVCAAIGLESKASCVDSLEAFDWDHVMVDRLGIARIILITFQSDSCPLPSPQSFSNDMSSLSLLFIALIDQLATSNSLSTSVDLNIRDHLISTIIHRLFNHLTSTNHVVLNCSPADVEPALTLFTLESQKLLNNRDVFDIFHRTTVGLYAIVHTLENNGFSKPTIRLTDSRIDLFSPDLPKSANFTDFMKLLEPELVKLKKEFDPELFGEAKRITLWKGLLERVASGEEVLKDKSFLKSSFFRPTLLSIQAKFQQLMSSVSESMGSSTSSLPSSHSTPHTSLSVHLNSSLQTPSSSTPFKQESIELLAIIHSLLSSPLHPSPDKQLHTNSFSQALQLFNLGDPSPTEQFHSSLFDEQDNEILAQSLVRCKTVCELFGAEKCILDISMFYDRIVSCLASSNSQVRSAALSIFQLIYDIPSVHFQLPSVWNRLSSAFRDGFPDEQLGLLVVSLTWIRAINFEMSVPPFPLNLFDWEGLFSADLTWGALFINAVHLIMVLRSSSIEERFGKAKVAEIVVKFERRQRAVSIINSFCCNNAKFNNSSFELFLSYSLMISLLISCDFPLPLTTFLTTRPDLRVTPVLPIRHSVVFLHHNILNRHKPHQPPLDLLFERTLRTNPLDFFLVSSKSEFDLLPSLRNTSLCAFHALCRRGVHLDMMESERIRSGWHISTASFMFKTQLISDTFHLFLYFPPPRVVRFFLPILRWGRDRPSDVIALKVMMMTLLLVTAPFGDCISLKELFRSSRHLNSIHHDTNLELGVLPRCKEFEMLSIPTGFGSALACSSKHVSMNHNTTRTQPHFSTRPSLNTSDLSTQLYSSLSDNTRSVSDGIVSVGSLIRRLKTKFTMMKSPVPATVSAMLEFVKRFVCLSEIGVLWIILCFGLLDRVIRAVSESSFLEDYENGICVIGILLRSIREGGNITNVIIHDFSPLLSRTGLDFDSCAWSDETSSTDGVSEGDDADACVFDENGGDFGDGVTSGDVGSVCVLSVCARRGVA
ncbi:hypothetical protein BLNAU_8412 [Blattamonas nauphoetae]|uniref:Uncharacterized protein n=1 Tax=Blattamonas nauphoetae TaxID=2049346 RepID=A0ABQ9XYL6_9EUKA|nr:hypothetical protein BLNAU_8412 [Blattamonas nauphoetae]